MKILQVCPYFHPHIGGVESHVKCLSKELVRRGHDVYVATSRLPGTKDEETLDGINIRRIKPWFIWFKTPVVPGLKRAIKELRCDIVHAQSPPPLPSYYAAKACFKSGTPFVITYHCDVEISSPLGRFVTELYRRTLEASTIRRADKVIVTTRTYAATSRNVWKAGPIIIPNMVDLDKFRPGISGEDLRKKLRMANARPTVLFVGRLTKHKGIEYLLEAARELDANFLIVGSGEREKHYREIAKNLRIEDKVLFAGKVSDEVLPGYYSISDVLALPSTSRLEAFGIVALESMASGRPVIISDIPGVRELITDGEEGVLVEPMNTRDLTAKISRILADEQKRKVMGAKARRKVEEEFSLEKVVDKIEAVYEKLLESQ